MFGAVSAAPMSAVNPSRWGRLLVVGLWSLLLLGCGLAQTTPSELRVGLLVPFPEAEVSVERPVTLFNGGAAQFGFRMGISAVNADPELLGATQLVGVEVSDNNDASGAVFGALYLAGGECSAGGAAPMSASGEAASSGDGVVAVVGSQSSTVSMQAQHVLGELGIPQVSHSSSSVALSDRDEFPTFSRVVPPDDEQAEYLARLAAHFGWKQVAVLHSTTSYGANLAQTFVQAASTHGLAVLGVSGFASGQTDLSAVVEAIANTHALVVFLSCGSTDARNVLREIDRQGLAGEDRVWLAPDGWLTMPATVDGTADEAVSRVLDGVIGTFPSVSRESAAYQAMEQAWAAETEEPFNKWAAFAHDAVLAIAHGAHAALDAGDDPTVDPSALLVPMRAASFEGATGTVRFTEIGDRVGVYDVLNRYRGDDDTIKSQFVATISAGADGVARFSDDPSESVQWHGGRRTVPSGEASDEDDDDSFAEELFTIVLYLSIGVLSLAGLVAFLCWRQRSLNKQVKSLRQITVFLDPGAAVGTKLELLTPLEKALATLKRLQEELRKSRRRRLCKVTDTVSGSFEDYNVRLQAARVLLMQNNVYATPEIDAEMKRAATVIDSDVQSYISHTFHQGNTMTTKQSKRKLQKARRKLKSFQTMPTQRKVARRIQTEGQMLSPKTFVIEGVTANGAGSVRPLTDDEGLGREDSVLSDSMSSRPGQLTAELAHIAEWEFDVFKCDEQARAHGNCAMVVVADEVLRRHHLLLLLLGVPMSGSEASSPRSSTTEIQASGKTNVSISDMTYDSSDHVAVGETPSLGAARSLSRRADVVRLYFAEISRGYLDNPYHNCLHGTDVLQSCSVMMSHKKLQPLLDPAHKLALLIAAAIHDFRHPGVSNKFLQATEADEAITWNDNSVLENMHVSEAFRLMRKPGLDLLGSVLHELRVVLRKMIIELVLSTDLAVTFKYISNMKSAVEQDPELEKDESATAVMCMVLKCCDVSHPSKPLQLHLNWTERIGEEFFRQGDREKKLGLPVSPLCDRDDFNLPKAQMGFIDFVVLPQYRPVAEFLETDEWLRRVGVSRAHWERELERPPPAPRTAVVVVADTSGRDASSTLHEFAERGGTDERKATDARETTGERKVHDERNASRTSLPGAVDSPRPPASSSV